MVKDCFALLGLALLTAGVGFEFGWPWASMVLGSLLFGCSVWGYLRDDSQGPAGE